MPPSFTLHWAGNVLARIPVICVPNYPLPFYSPCHVHAFVQLWRCTLARKGFHTTLLPLSVKDASSISHLLSSLNFGPCRCSCEVYVLILWNRKSVILYQVQVSLARSYTVYVEKLWPQACGHAFFVVKQSLFINITFSTSPRDAFSRRSRLASADPRVFMFVSTFLHLHVCGREREREKLSFISAIRFRVTLSETVT